ncbi:MAG: phosphotransferase [Ruminococcus bromii]|nr:phosphotransferase [Ruminococcus bromii]
MEQEILLTGGRITQGVARRGDRVYRPMCANSDFVHRVLVFLEKIGAECVPRFYGTDDRNREILSYLEGSVPPDLGWFSEEQCCRAAFIVKKLHDHLRSFPGCPEGMTVCHNDLSPCNFVFSGERPVGIIDWDAAAFGDPLDDLAYFTWMWLNIGHPENKADSVRHKTNAILNAYGVPDSARKGFERRMLRQMERVGSSVFPTEAQTRATHQWTECCRDWDRTNLGEL